MFDASFFRGNRLALYKKARADCVVITAAGLVQRSADTAFAFKQDTNFWYLTGCNQPDFLLVITEHRHVLIKPKRDKHRDLWEGEISAPVLQKVSGVDEILSYQDGMRYIKHAVMGKKVATIVPPKSYINAHGLYTNPARATLYRRIKRLQPAQIIDARSLLALLRQYKKPQEIAAIQKAINITAQSLDIIKDHISTLTSESDIQHRLTYEFVTRGAQGHAYDPIIASDKNATTIHYTANNSSLKNAAMVLYDVGAEYNHYAADVSRTYALKPPTKRLSAVHMAVHNTQQQLISELKPGVTLKELEKKTEQLLAAHVKALGLHGNVRSYYPHGVSHHLGLDVHDAADYAQPLLPGMVITIEPGLYIPNESIGVRVEDDVLITDTGANNLSAKIPHSLLYYM